MNEKGKFIITEKQREMICNYAKKHHWKLLGVFFISISFILMYIKYQEELGFISYYNISDTEIYFNPIYKAYEVATEVIAIFWIPVLCLTAIGTIFLFIYTLRCLLKIIKKQITKTKERITNSDKIPETPKLSNIFTYILYLLINAAIAYNGYILLFEAMNEGAKKAERITEFSIIITEDGKKHAQMYENEKNYLCLPIEEIENNEIQYKLKKGRAYPLPKDSNIPSSVGYMMDKSEFIKPNNEK